MSTLSPLHHQNAENALVRERFSPPTVALPSTVRVGSVPYLNARPLTRCISSPVTLLEPSRLAADLRAGHLDAGLVPLMEVLEAPAGMYRIVNGLAIGAQRAVYSVYLNYTGALGNIKTVALDPASKTSVELTRLVLEKFNRLKPRYVTPDEPADAQLLIGDPAIIHRQANPDQKYLDLGEAWRAQTQLPFVFAVWALRLPLWQSFWTAQKLRQAARIGVANRNFIAKNAFERSYLNEHLCYELGESQKLAMAKFAAFLVELERLPPRAEIEVHMIQSLLDSEIKSKVFAGERISPEEAKQLYYAPLTELGELADARRRQAKGPAYDGRGNEIVTYIIDRNINYTNVCNVYCKFCAFMRTEKDEDHYVLSNEQIGAKITELESIGGTQILMQGGHHPKLTIDYYLELLHYIRQNHPTINIHGFSPPEFNHFATVFGLSLEEVISRFKDAGLGSIPGGGGEILVDDVRNRIAPLKCNTDQWLEVMRIAHRLGLSSSATMMFGHVESIDDRIEHLRRLRDVQDETKGFTAFICWTFQSDGTKMRNIPPTGSHEYLRMQALSRVFLDNFDNVQSSWVTQGPKIGQVALQYGANDYGSVMMEENVVSAAGTSFRLTVDEIKKAITELGYEARQRDNWYRLL